LTTVAFDRVPHLVRLPVRLGGEPGRLGPAARRGRAAAPPLAIPAPSPSGVGSCAWARPMARC